MRTGGEVLEERGGTLQHLCWEVESEEPRDSGQLASSKKISWNSAEDSVYRVTWGHESPGYPRYRVT